LKPPSFGPASELRVSSNLSHIITNARKVDQTRLASKVKNPRAKIALLDHNATVHDISEPNEKISLEEANSRLIARLKTTVKHLTDTNKSLSYQKDTLELNWKKEIADHQSNIKAKQKEVEERNLKLAVLEQHFCALNDPQKQEIVPPSKHTNSNNDEKNQTELPLSAVISNTNAGGQSNYSSSIIQLDKSHYVGMQDDLKKTKDKLANLEVKHTSQMEESTNLQMELNSQVKDLNESLSKREETISRLEKSLKALREARFKKKTPSREKSRKSLEPMKESASPPVTDNEEEETTSSITKTDSHCISSIASVEIDKAVATAVESAIKDCEEDHKTNIELLNNQMEIKDKIIKRLETKCFALVKSKTADPMPRKLMVRNIASTNEALDVTIQRLERLVEPLMATKGEGVEPVKNSEDEFGSIRRVAAKVSLVHEELKLSMKLIEKQIENGVEKIRQTKSTDESVDYAEEESNTSKDEKDENNEDSTSLKETILRVQDESMKALRDTESAITKVVDDLKEQLQTIEFELESKQDTIEALEHACSEHIQNCRGLQEKIEELTSKVEVEGQAEF
jgi:chromosome segregation ATPase